MDETKHTSTNTYSIQGVLGEGSNGVVYKALKSDELSQIQTTVALKVLNSRELVEIWKREFLSLKDVRSHYCVQVYGFERVMQKPALSLEFVEGLNLLELVTFVSLDKPLIKEVTAQILHGLADLWEHGLFHGDLSPGNVLVSTAGQVKLLDFGLGNRIGSVKLGTPQFIAPEVMTGEGEGRAADLYSLGRVIEFLCVGDFLDDELKKQVENLTEKNAELRKRPEVLESPERKSQLAGVVRKAYLEKQYEIPQTKEFVVKSVVIPMNSSPPLKMAKAGLLKYGIIAALVLISVFIFLKFAGDPGTGDLKVRTSTWYKIFINGKDYGYTPVDALGIESGQVEISWESSSASGKRVLTLKEGENMVISDDFFEKQNGE